MEAAPSRTHTCGESKSVLGVGAQKICGGFESGIAYRVWHPRKSQSGNSHRNVSDKRHWRGQGETNQSPAGRGKADTIKA